MKAKWLLAIVIIILLVGGGIGYWMGVLPSWRSAADSKPQAPPSPLHIEEQKEAALGESGVEGHRDLRFENQANKRLTLHLVSSDCECASVSICVTPAEWKQLDSPAFLQRAAEPTLAWQTLQRDGASFTVPPLAQGMIRVTWKANKVGASAIGLVVNVDDGENKSAQRFGVPVAFVASAWLGTEDDYLKDYLDVGHLKPGEERKATFLCCSATRKKFTLTPAPPSDDPCILYGAPQPLSAEELQALPKAPDGKPILSAFRVTITVKERAGGKQFDIGPFHRAIVYKADIAAGMKVTAFLEGTVEGEVGLASSEGKDFVDLGLIIPSKPRPVTFTLRSRDPQLQLTLDEQRTLDFLHAELLDGKEGKPSENGKSWRVRVRLRTDSTFRGPIPNPTQPAYASAGQCSVAFTVAPPGKAAGPARRLLIPVRGRVRVY